MVDTYFDYVLSKCRSQVIKKICERYQLRAHLQKSITETWSDYPSIITDGELLHTFRELFRNREMFQICDVAGDALTIYDRCNEALERIRTGWRNRAGLNYDSLFNTLVDLCWLLASNEYSERSNYRSIELLSNPKQINTSIRSYLESIYIAAIKEHNESVYIGEGINAKNEHPFIPVLYDNRYQESMCYIRSDSKLSELQDIKNQYEYWCNYHLTLYYNLTATAALADNIMRGLC